MTLRQLRVEYLTPLVIIVPLRRENSAILRASTKLARVRRKTANMVLGNAFGAQAIAVDTHVARVSQRLGLAHSKNADKVKQELTAQVAQDEWTAFTNAMILHGRGVCGASHATANAVFIESVGGRKSQPAKL